MKLGLFSILLVVHLMMQAVVLYNVMQLLFHRMADLLIQKHYHLDLMEHWVVCGKVGVRLDCMVQMVTHVVREGRLVQMMMDIVMYLQTDRVVHVVVHTVMYLVVDMLMY